MKASTPILYVGQLKRWRNNLRRKLLVVVVFVFVDLDGWALQLVLLIRGVSGFHHDSGLSNQSEIPLSLASSLFLWSETICMVFFRASSLCALLF